VLEFDPDAKLAIGPPVENGFYYDFELSRQLSDADLKKIEKRMRKIVTAGFEPEKKVYSYEEAKKKVKGQDYKLELIEEFNESGEKLSFYTIADFEDLCEGPHVDSSKEIDPKAFKLSKVAGAYWKGDEKNKMLTRVYGFAFESKDKLDDYLKMLEEAKKRDHRKLGKELGLFTFSELVGPGLPLWSPKGTVLREQLDKFVQELRAEKGYERVTIPHLAKVALYERSGHWQKYSEDLFKVQAKEGDDHETYVLKPMNCPHHTQIFDSVPRSYKEIPKRFAETTMVYRAEQSGELAGLTRVLSITQDDAHVFCRESQVKNEIKAIWDIVDRFYSAFNLNLEVSLSFRDMENQDKYIGDPKLWDDSENALLELAKERNAKYFVDPGEAAFYGPKLDFIARDSIGRKHQVATIQLDRNLPERFDLNCINEEGEKVRIVMIHAAITGSLERFSAILIEHTAGKFPTWLAPVQVYILPIANVHEEYAQKVSRVLKENGLRVELLSSKDSLGKRIRVFKKDGVPYALVLGDKELGENSVTAEKRNGEKLELPLNDFVTQIKEEIRKRSFVA
jgi:threonyl-tRNA synthetase